MKVFKFFKEEEYSRSTYLISANNEEEAKDIFVAEDHDLNGYEISLFEKLSYDSNIPEIIDEYWEGE